MSILQNVIRDKQDIRNQLGTTPQTFGIPINFNRDIQVEKLVTIVQQKFIGESMIWGSAQFGTWGVAEWGSPPLPLVFDSPTQGFLDEQYIFDEVIIPENYAVLPKNNTFRDYLVDDLFISEFSTGSRIDGAYNLEPGQTLISNTICKLRSRITSAEIITLNGTGDFIIEMSNDNGSNWSQVTKKINFNTSANTDELKYRITATTSSQIIGPVVIKIN